MHQFEKRLARLEPPPPGNQLHVFEVANERSPAVDAILKEIGEQPGDLTVLLRRFVEEPFPPRHLYSMPLGSRS